MPKGGKGKPMYEEIIQPLLLSLLKDGLYVLAIVVGALIVYLAARYVAPILREKLGDTRYNALVTRIKNLMCAAEQKFSEASSGLTKSEFVIKLIREKFPKLDESYIQTIIDGLMAPMEAEGLVNVTEGKDLEEYLSYMIDKAIEKINIPTGKTTELIAPNSESGVNPDPYAPGATPDVDAEEPPQNPDPEALDAPPID